jgi:hypothetical protein
VTAVCRCRVPPFGYLRIHVRLQLPVAFRCLPRPSSPPGAKASPVRPLYLDLFLRALRTLSLSCLNLSVSADNNETLTGSQFVASTFRFRRTTMKPLQDNNLLPQPFRFQLAYNEIVLLLLLIMQFSKNSLPFATPT